MTAFLRLHAREDANVDDALLQRRPRLAFPFTILTGAAHVRLVAGEDYRYTLSGPRIEHWLPPILERLAGKETLAALLAPLKADERAAALEVVQHLYGERVLVDGSAADAHSPRKFMVDVQGQGPLVSTAWESGAGAGDRLVVFCQDSLDYEAALAIHRHCREEKTPWLWASYGALNRAYVSPLFLPDAGPCFGCLLRAFRRLSPAPEIYDALCEHAQRGRSIAAVDFPAAGLQVVRGLVQWKLDESARDEPAPALYRLHVLECENFEVSTHRVFADPFCPECGPEGPCRAGENSVRP